MEQRQELFLTRDSYRPSDGDGDGDGYGSGSGSGSGDGCGDGSGSGSGSGTDVEKYWLQARNTLRFSPKQLTRVKELDTQHIPILFWKSAADGTPSNGGKSIAVFPGLFQEIKGPLELCGPGALHATLIPPKWQGSRLWLVALHGEVKFENDKAGALKREILAECFFDDDETKGEQ